MIMKMLIKIHVPYETAVRKGSPRSGHFTLEPTEQDLQALSPEERELLASAPRLSSNDTVTVQLSAFGASETADFSAVRPLLAKFKAKNEADEAERQDKKAREAEEAARENARKAGLVRTLVDQVRTDVRTVTIKTYWTSDNTLDANSQVGVTADSLVYWSDVPNHLVPEDRDVLDLIKAEFQRRLDEKERQAQGEREAAEKVKMTEKIFVHRYGSAEQIERYDAGYLPEEELQDLVCNKLFAAFAADTSITSYVRLKNHDVTHDDECYAGAVKFEVDVATELLASSFAKLRQLQTIAAQSDMSTTVTPRLHEAECTACSMTATRLSAKVEMEWNGRKLSREYTI